MPAEHVLVATQSGIARIVILAESVVVATQSVIARILMLRGRPACCRR